MRKKTRHTNRALIVTHLGLGDMFWMNGAVRYLCTRHDEILVACKKQYAANARLMYRDDPRIRIYDVKESKLTPFPEKRATFERQGLVVYACGYHKENPRIFDFPLSFYDDLSIPRDYRQKYFFVEPMPEGQRLFESVSRAAPDGRYVVLHQESSRAVIDVSGRFDRDRTLLLDLNKNLYPHGHRWHRVAQLAVNRPLVHYVELLEGAHEIHVIESSVYCLASHLDLSKVTVKKCFLPFDNSAARIGVFETGHV